VLKLIMINFGPDTDTSPKLCFGPGTIGAIDEG